jgi:hypothetical protein
MKKSFFSKMIIAIIGIATFVSCSKTGNGDVEYIPYLETTDGQWGMISLDGKVLFSEEFKTKPTVVRDQRFFVRNNSGIWEMYEATEKPKKIGGDYAHVSGFRNGVAIVSEKGKPVSLIDKDGKTIKLLDKLDGKVVHGVRNFEDGYAVFMTEDSLFGAIDEKGTCVVKPQYCSLNNHGDNKFIGVNAKYKDYLKQGKKEKIKISIINTSGKELFNINGDKYVNMGRTFTDGLLAVCVKKDAKEIWGIINDKGDVIVKPSMKIKDIGAIHGKNFTYNNGEGWGLMNTDGETLIRAKYEWLYYDNEKLLIAAVKDGDFTEYKYIDEEDNQIGDEKFVRASLFSMFDGEHALVKPNDKTYAIINKSGEQVEGLPDIVRISTYEGEDYVESDYVDLNRLFKAANISKNSALDFTFNTTPKEAIKIKNSIGQIYLETPLDPYWYDVTDKVFYYKIIDCIICTAGISYPGNLSKETFTTKRVVDFDFGDYYYYHNEKKSTGYVWNNYKPTLLSFAIQNSGRMHGKLRSLYNIIADKFRAMGTVAKENNSALIVELGDNKRALVSMEKTSVSVIWGELAEAKDIDIDKYKDAVEEGDDNSISYGYLNDLFPDENASNEEDVDSIEVADID